MRKIKLGIVGLGDRGYGLLRDVIVKSEDYEVVAVCDIFDDRNENAVSLIKSETGVDAKTYKDYKKLLKDPDVEAVLVATGWEMHNDVAIAAMKNKKAVALEVGGAFAIKELWDLVDTYEETKTPIMLLENCCFDWAEMTATSMARDGILGDIVYCSGAYGHDLRYLLSSAWKNRNYRLDEYIKRNCDNYPTHDLGPIAKVLDINRGNRMISLVSVSSRAAGLKEYIKNHPEIDENIETINVKQGDVVNTIITCANGETILLRLDTTLPRYYSRDFTIRGTKGMYEQAPNSVFLDGDNETGFNNGGFGNKSEKLNNLQKYEEKYLPEMLKGFTKEERLNGHSVPDTVEFKVFANALRNGEEMPIDVYDTAAWMSISCLSEQSIALGGTPQTIPDFTRGKWITRKRKDVIDFTADVKYKKDKLKK